MKRSLIAVSVLALTTFGCAAGAQNERTQIAGVHCAGVSDDAAASILDPGRVHRVEQTHATVDRFGERSPLYVSGAELYIAAERDMNEAYLERALSCHAASVSATEHPNDPLRANEVRSIDVRSEGQSFVIAIEGRDREAGEEIWRRAEALQHGASSVSVEQIGGLSSARL